MKHKIGDIVKIRTWKSMENEFGVNRYGDIPQYPYFSPRMKYLCGGYVVIIDVEPDKYRGLHYWFDDWMFDER